MKQRTCSTCGASFSPRHARVFRCPLHQPQHPPTIYAELDELRHMAALQRHAGRDRRV